MAVFYSAKELSEALKISLHTVRRIRNNYHHADYHKPEGLPFNLCLSIARVIQRDLDKEMAGTLEGENLILRCDLRRAQQRVQELEVELQLVNNQHKGERF